MIKFDLNIRDDKLISLTYNMQNIAYIYKYIHKLISGNYRFLLQY